MYGATVSAVLVLGKLLFSTGGEEVFYPKAELEKLDGMKSQ